MSRFSEYYYALLSDLSNGEVKVFQSYPNGLNEKPNSHKFSLHCRYRMSTAGTSKQFCSPLTGHSIEEKKHLDTIGAVGEFVVSQVLNVPGITWVGIDEYFVNIEIGIMFSIQEVAPAVAEILKSLGEPPPCNFDEVGDTSALDEDFHRGLTE